MGIKDMTNEERVELARKLADTEPYVYQIVSGAHDLDSNAADIDSRLATLQAAMPNSGGGGGGNITPDNIVGVTVLGKELMTIKSVSDAWAALGLSTSGETLWVDSINGLDTNTGRSINTPFKTIQAAIDSATRETTILVSSGTYAGFTVNKPTINIVGMSTKSEVVNITDTCTLTNDANIIRFEKLFFSKDLILNAIHITQLDRCIVNTVTVAGPGDLSDIGSTINSLAVTGTSIVNLQAGAYGDISINNAYATVTLFNPLAIRPSAKEGIILKSGKLFINNARVRANGTDAAGVTANENTTIVLNNVAFVDNTTAPAVINIDKNAICTINNSTFNYTTSKIPDINNNSVPIYSDVIRAQKLSLTSAKSQRNSSAIAILTLVTDFNNLLDKLRAVGVLAP